MDPPPKMTVDDEENFLRYTTSLVCTQSEKTKKECKTDSRIHLRVMAVSVFVCRCRRLDILKLFSLKRG